MRSNKMATTEIFNVALLYGKLILFLQISITICNVKCISYFNE